MKCDASLLGAGRPIQARARSSATFDTAAKTSVSAEMSSTHRARLSNVEHGLGTVVPGDMQLFYPAQVALVWGRRQELTDRATGCKRGSLSTTAPGPDRRRRSTSARWAFVEGLNAPWR